MTSPIQHVRRTWDEYVPTWKELRSLGRSRVVNSAVFIPMIGYYILYGEQFEQYFRLWSSLETGAATGFGPLDWALSLNRLNFFYFGLCSVAIGAVIFGLGCPPIVRDFQDYAEYLARGTGKRSRYMLDYLAQEILKRPEANWPWYTSWRGDIENAFGSVFHKHDKNLDRDALNAVRANFGDVKPQYLEEAVEALMLMHYSLHSWSNFRLRIICAGFYAFGFCLVGISAVLAFLVVVIATLP